MSLADEYKGQMARIKVVGVGGAGRNTVNCMIASNVEGVEFATLDTEDKAVIEESLKGTDMVFITAGMGDGAGTDTAPVIAKIAKELGILLTIAVVTKPLIHEAKARAIRAEAGIKELEKSVDMLIVLSNDRIARNAEKELPLTEHFGLANDVIKQALQWITDLILKPGLIGIDFYDIKRVVQNSGRAAMGIGVVKGKAKGRAVAAVKKAMANILTEHSSMKGARGILCSITADIDITLTEVEKVVGFLYGLSHKDDNIVIGAVPNPYMQDETKVTIIATGFDEKKR